MAGYPEALATRSLGELQPLTQLSEARRREANLRKIWEWCLGRGIGLGVSFRMQTSQNAPCATGPVCSNSREAEVQLLCLGQIELFEFAAELEASEPSKQSEPSCSSSPASSVAASSLFYSCFPSMSSALSPCRNEHGHRDNYVPILAKPSGLN